jgi:small subunit ribosomal protein S9
VSGETPPPEDQQGADERTPQADAPTEPPLDEGTTPGAPEPGATAEEEPSVETPAQPAAEAAGSAADDDAAAAEDEGDADEDDATPRVKPAIPGMDLEVDIVTEGDDPLRGRAAYGDEEDLSDAADEQLAAADDADADEQPITTVAIDLGADARYTATGKRKTAIARVILRPGTGAYMINGRPLDEFFPRPTLQRTIRQPLETVGYEERMDVIARMEGGGVSAQAGALRHGISRALLEADPNLRGELKRRGFLTRDARAKERKKAGLKKARKRPQFSKR